MYVLVRWCVLRVVHNNDTIHCSASECQSCVCLCGQMIPICVSFRRGLIQRNVTNVYRIVNTIFNGIGLYAGQFKSIDTNAENHVCTLHATITIINNKLLIRLIARRHDRIQIRTDERHSMLFLIHPTQSCERKSVWQFETLNHFHFNFPWWWTYGEREAFSAWPKSV